MFDWKDITPLEKKLIEATKEAKEIILEKVPKEEIIAVYLTGSLPRREANEDSDVDTTTVLKSDRYKAKVEELNNEMGNAHVPRISFSTLTEKQLRTNTSDPGKALPDRFLKRLDMAMLLYGSPLDLKEYKVRTDLEELEGEIEHTIDWAIPTMQKKAMGFQQFAKKVFWLAESEYRLINKKSPKNWKDLLGYFEKNHIIHEAMKYRNKNTHDEKKRSAFISKLENYLSVLRERYLVPGK